MAYRVGGGSDPPRAGLKKGAAFCRMKKKEREEKTEKERPQREKERDNNNCLLSLLMSLWFTVYIDMH